MKLFDTHCDTAVRCYNGFGGREGDVNGTPLLDNTFHISLKKAEYLAQYTQLFAIWDDDAMEPDEGFRFFKDALAFFHGELEKNSDRIALCRRGADLDSAKNIAILAVENGKLLNGDMARLHFLYEQGVRLMTLTWNQSNCIGHGAFSGMAEGLTAFGRAVIKEMNRMKMTVDVSHLNDAGFFDVACTATAPFIASHSNCRAVCNHPRNLTDEQIREICGNGGLIGLNFGGKFISETSGDAYTGLMRHVYHILNLGGEDCLCFGADFDGTDVPEQLNGITAMQALYDFMSQTDLGAALTDKIFYQNAFHYFQNML